MSHFFKEVLRDKTSGARAGVLTTSHGEILTPAFVPVGTQGTVKSLDPCDLTTIGVQIFFVNTYHIYLRPGVEAVEKAGGLHKFTGWGKPLMTDSGGFQIFSLAREKYQTEEEGISSSLVKVDDDGVTFRSHLDGSLHRFTPEVSIETQQKLGADIILAFDQCPPYGVSKDEARKAMERTHDWAIRSLGIAWGKPMGGKQLIFGIIQGGVFNDLREESAKFISNLPFEGIAIGGVAVGESKREMQQVLDWVAPYLPWEKPRHLLGVGEIDDLFEGVERGIDMFDCVMPTRLARMGHILTKVRADKWRMDITKSIFAEDFGPLVEGCQCFTCLNFSRAYLNHLFRSRELLAYRLATYHNLWFVTHLMREMREAIIDGGFQKLKTEWLGS